MKKNNVEVYNTEEKLSLELTEMCDNVKNNILGICTSIWRKRNQRDIKFTDGG